MKEIYKLKDEFLALHRDYKATWQTIGDKEPAADNHQPPWAGIQPLQLQAIVDSMLALLLKIVDLAAKLSADGKDRCHAQLALESLQDITRESEKPKQTPTTPSLDGASLLNNQAASNGDNDELVASENLMDLQLVKHETQSDNDIEENDDSCSGSNSSGSSSDSTSSNSDTEPAASDTESESLSDASDGTDHSSNQTKSAKRSKGSTRKTLNVKSKTTKPKPTSLRMKMLEENAARFLADKSCANDVIPKSNLGKFSPKQRRDIFQFYESNYKHNIMGRQLMKIIQTKYPALRKTCFYRILDAGRRGEGFEYKTHGPRKGKHRKEQENPHIAVMLDKMVEYAKANPFTVTLPILISKFMTPEMDVGAKTIRRMLRERGAKLYTAKERRAIRLNMEGKEYVPFSDPQMVKYNRLRFKMKREQAKLGQKVDGRTARHKDPNYKSFREQAGIPIGHVVYEKRWREEQAVKDPTWQRKWNERQNQRQHERANMKGQRRTKKLDQPASDASNTDSQAAQPTLAALPQSSASFSPHPRPATRASGSASGWQLQFDPHTGNLQHGQYYQNNYFPYPNH